LTGKAATPSRQPSKRPKRAKSLNRRELVGLKLWFNPIRGPIDVSMIQRSRAGLLQAPIVIIGCGCLIAILTFGPRTTMGLLLPAIGHETGWTRDIFALAIAVQHLVWGIGQPFGGAVADRVGTVRALSIGGILYAAGLFVMASASTPAALFSSGALLGLGLSGASFNIVLAAFGKLLPDDWRPLATGIGGAAGSLGQFLFSPFCVLLLDSFSWRITLLVFGSLVLLVLPLSLPLSTWRLISEQKKSGASAQTLWQDFLVALRNRSFVLMICGFFVSGFVNLHLPAYLQDEGLDRPSAGWVIAAIGLFNILGSVTVGWLCGHFANRHVLSSIYFLRALAIAGLLALPLSSGTALVFAAAMGLLWTAPITPVAGTVLQLFGAAHMAAIYGLAYFFHQFGAFFGVWVGGVVFEQTGSYNSVWTGLAVASLAASLLALLARDEG
jgi:MFS family permease